MATFDERWAALQPRMTIPAAVTAQSPAPAPPAPTAQDAPQPPQPQANPQIAADLSEANAAIKEARQSIDEQKRIAEQKAQSQAPVIARMQQLAQQPLPERKPAVQAPPAPQRQDQQADENWLFASSILGALAGAFTRRHQTNALAAFSGAIQGYQEGSQIKFDQNMKIWEAENKRATEANAQAQQEYKDILENRKLSMEQMSIELQLAGQKYDDQAMVTTARTNNLLHIAQLLDTRARYAEIADLSAARMAQSFQQFQDRQKQTLLIAQMRAIGANTPEQMQATIDRIGQYKGPPIAGKAGIAIMEAVSEKYPDYDAAKWIKKSREEGAEGTAVGGRLGGMESAVRGMDALIKPALDAANKIPHTTWQTVNEWRNKAAEEMSDPLLRDFKIKNLNLAEKWAQAMNPRGVMRETDRAFALKNLNDADGPAAYLAAVKALKQFADREMTAIKEQKEGAPLPEVEFPEPAPAQTVPQIIKGTGRSLSDQLEAEGLRRLQTPAGTPTYKIPDYSIGRGTSAPAARSLEELFR